MPHPFIPAPGVARVQVVFNYRGGIVENVFHVFTSPGDWEYDDLTRLADTFEAWLTEQWATVADVGAEVVKIIATAVHADDGDTYTLVPDPAIVGALNVGYYMRSSTVAMSWRTNQIGRSHRGRTFHVGLTPNSVDGSNANMLSSGGRTALLAVYDDLLVRLGNRDTGLGLAVVSYMEDGDWRSTAEVTVIQNVITDFRVDTMRRRMNARPT